MMVLCPECGKAREIISRHDFVAASQRMCRSCRDLRPRSPETARRQAEALILANSEVDPIAVERMVNGRPPASTTRAEREEAVAVLSGMGWGSKRIAAHIGVTDRTVCRLRARRRVAA